jgi:hypothetical protein
LLLPELLETEPDERLLLPELPELNVPEERLLPPELFKRDEPEERLLPELLELNVPDGRLLLFILFERTAPDGRLLPELPDLTAFPDWLPMVPERTADLVLLCPEELRALTERVAFGALFTFLLDTVADER